MELIFTSVVLLALILVASFIFYKRIKAAQIEYENAKDSVQNITFGFSRQVIKLEQELGNSKIEATTAKIAASEAYKNSIETKETTLKALEAVKNVQNQTENDSNIIKNLETRMDNTDVQIDSLKKEIQKLASVPKTRVNLSQQIPTAIPVQQENIIDRLTDTEINILQKIADLDEGTVPEIKEHLGLTREHTARMLKKLYENGYVDRSTNSMPYRYIIRKEIRDLIILRKENLTLFEK